MKRFRRITALALTLVVITMLGISASAASETINGDFGAFAHFEWNLTTSEAWASAAFCGAEENYIDFEYQHLVITGQSVSQNAPYTFSSVEDEEYSYGEDDDDNDNANANDNYTVSVYDVADEGYRIQYVKYTYGAYYIANGVVDCYLNYGPVTIRNP